MLLHEFKGMLIIYGSQTGKSQHVARLIEQILKTGYDEKLICKPVHKSQSAVMEMDKFDFSKILDARLIIFVCSTHGDGTEPFNMSNFWYALRNPDLPSNLLANLRFAVFGLGDSSYQKYNFASKKLYNCLAKLGATPVIRRGCGDDMDPEGYLTDFKVWVQELTSCLGTNYEFDDPSKYISNEVYSSYTASFLSRRVLTDKSHFQNIFECGFMIDEYGDFLPGDCISILPDNYNYKDFIRYNKLFDDSILEKWESSDVGISGRELKIIDHIKNRCDFNSVPQPFFFSVLYQYMAKKLSKEVSDKIYEIFSDYDFYYDYILRPKRTIFETLVDLQVKLSYEFIEWYIPLIYPRYFTLAKKDNIFYITVAEVSHKTVLKTPRQSICCRYLLSLDIDSKFSVRIQRSKLFFGARNLLFICTGVGITLPRSVINHFSDKRIVVFYGFRYRNKDMLYLEELESKGVELYQAASRDDGKYVQDVFRTGWDESLDDFLVFVSGNSRLNKIISEEMYKKYGKKVVFQSETW